MIISIDTEKASDKNWYPFPIKTHNKLGLEKKNYLNIIKAIYENSKPNTRHNGKRMQTFHLRSRRHNACFYNFYKIGFEHSR